MAGTCSQIYWSFEKQGYSLVLEEENMNDQSLMDAVHKVWSEKDSYISAMEQSHAGNGVENVMRVILSLTKEEPSEEISEEISEEASGETPDETPEETSGEDPGES